ncbi:phosphatidylinositol 3 [Xylaria nigripes]|nr:phosphatidylinositol 3 [Xylaria nigripes]
MPPRPVVRELTMKQALEAIEGSSRPYASIGLDSLIHIFKHQVTASDLLKLDDKSYHRLFEALFRFTLAEKEAYYHSKGVKSIASARLTKCAEVFRLSVEHGASKIKRKTFSAVIDHIADILPHPDDGLVPPLVSDYVKALATLLGHGANAEILATHNSDGWFTCVDFVVEIISHYAGSDDRDIDTPRASPAPSAGSSMTLPFSTSRPLNSSKRNNGKEWSPRGHLSNLMECLSALVSAPNAPLLQRAKEIASVAFHLLQLRYLGLSQLHQLAFAVINALLVATQTDDTAQASSLAVECLPLIIYWWQARAASKYDALLNAVRIEMLKVLYNIHLQLKFMARQNCEATLFEDIENLLEVLWSEYSKRDDRAQLQQDDLAYVVGHVPTHYFRTQSFVLRSFNIEGERQWAVVQVLAMLEGILCMRGQSLRTDGEYENSEQPRKKPRKDAGIDRLRHKLRSIDHSMQFTTLQMIPFFVSDVDITAEETCELLSILLGFVANQNSRLSTWAMIACASLCAKSTSVDGSLSGLWKQIWQVGVRSIRMTETCRAASFLLYSITTNNLLTYSEIMRDISDMVTNADVNGPDVLVDSSLILMTALLRLRNHHVPNASQATSNHIIRWMLSRWHPVDATFISSYSIHVSPLNIANLIRAACGVEALTLPNVSQTISGPIAENLFLLYERESVVKYLLLSEDGASSLRSQSSHKIALQQADVILTHSISALATTKLVAELFHSKLEKVAALCGAWAKKIEGFGHIMPEKLQSVISSLLLGALILPQLRRYNAQQAQETEEVISRTLRDLLEALSSSPECQSLSEHLLRSVRAYIPELTKTDLSRLSADFPYLHKLFAEVSVYMRLQIDQQSAAHINDAMDIDGDFESQGSRSSALLSVVDTPRRESLVIIQASSFYSDTTQRLHFMAQLYNNTGQIGLIPIEFLDAFLLLPDRDLLSCRCFIRELFNSGLVISPDDAQKVIERMGILIGQLTFSSCEVALNICLDLMEGFMAIWSSGDTKLSSLVGDLYKHYIKKGLSSNLLSPKVRISLSRLLIGLAQAGENFHETVGMDPPTTSLLGILETSSLPVKFYIGSQLPSLFGRYILKIHEDMFVNILENLPTNNVFLEGIALRLFVLGEIARQWPTLLRRGIYHIFETPGKVPGSKEHAAYILKRIASTLKLDGPRQLFDLFSSQLLYTWLDEGTVEDIPFEIFGFPNLEALVHRAQADVVALMVMRAQDEALEKLALSIRTTSRELVQRNFSKTLAYCMAHDISMPKGAQHQSGESRLRKLLGRETFLGSVYLNFADIVGTFISVIDQEDPIERSWARDSNFAHAAEVMANIKQCGHSDVVLGANQQPTFRPKYLTREIALLCSRTEYELSTLWNSALVVSVARRLFGSIHNALGPLYACSILRKVRVLICLAGPHAWNSYPLEMLLHSIRPYIVDTECADDSIGMSQFLLEKGYDSLAESPSFLAGYALTTLASLRVFFGASQSSTTQESQFKATMSKAQRFHAWFTNYLESFASSALKDGRQRDAFKAITESAAYVRSSGNADEGTHESRLLFEILRDQDRGTKLLSDASHKLALEMLCRHFTMPATSSIDFLHSDEEAQALAKAVWRSCKSHNLSGEYLAWAGRVIGRGFVSSGHIDADLLRESQLSKFCQYARGESASEQGLLNLLQALTADSCHTTAGLAESALRTIVSEATAQGDGSLLAACEKILPSQLFQAFNWSPYQTPPSDNIPVSDLKEDVFLSPDSIHRSNWAENITMCLIANAQKNVVLNALCPILMNVEGFAKEAFPYIIHLTLLNERKSNRSTRQTLSEALKPWFQTDSLMARDNIGLLMNAILYLRTQKRPGEASIADRMHWLELDLALASSAARKCGMYKTALLFIELSSPEDSRASRRSSTVRAQEPTEQLLDIFENIDDPDAYYGLSEIPSLTNVLARLEYEKDGVKSLAFRGAQYDSHIRKSDSAAVLDSQYLVDTLGSLGLSGLSNALLQYQQSLDNSSSAVDNAFNTARKLEIWNLPALSSTRQPSLTIYKTYQAWNQATELSMVRRVAWSGFTEIMQNVLQDDMSASSLRNHLGALAVLTELNDTIDVVNSTELNQLLETFNSRSHWMKAGRYDEVGQILSCRETTMSLLSQFSNRSEITKVNPPEARLVQVKSMLLSSSIHRYHQAFQESLNIATSLTHLVQPSAKIGLIFDSAARDEVANSLWDHGEMMSSIRTLQLIDEDTDFKKQTLAVSRSDLLAKTAYQISVAKLEKPDSIHRNYLEPALKELKGKADGEEAGKVYHQFATFCDEQLQDPDGLEDLARLKHLRQGKQDEVAQLRELRANAKETQTRSRFNSHLDRAKQWLELDEQELRRVEQNRSEFVRLSLENYLLSLIASDRYNNDALRFTALWLERAAEDYTNKAVRKYIDKVPTRKFAPLMNQLTSRLLYQSNPFQELLIDLVYRICVDHPYHGMYQIWSGTCSKPKKEDETAQLRKQATEKVGKKLSHTEGTASTWSAICHTSKAYHVLALDNPSDGPYKGGQKIPIGASTAGQALANVLAKYRIPPPTMQINLSVTRDYSNVPLVAKLEPVMTIATGVSAPKIITIIGSNGEHFKQLVKSGNDDLRQDAIMEQVFAAVSSVLKLHRSTRQRNLGIRTYKVLPLTSISGLIEFVPNTIPLHDYLMPAHEKYHPRDYKGLHCRKEISNVQTRSSEVRLATYRKVTDHFQPAMRYFFMEYFTDPDDWFAKRTAYTRTTAAISMLGHVLGLGDRHGHNILLDSKNGEVVHIDLGVAFEAGRVLPVPELVPFRLTRDIVDGMGITKTEGVFRRCCEFTLDALREETYSIMTILDVLRYDPLYSWSISPVRLAKLQDPRRYEEGVELETEVNSKKKNTASKNSSIVNEPSEAHRALEVVRKKLSKTLSVTATVNDLINQATDERNLAVLYSGWAAYA